MADNKKEKVGVQDIADILNISASTVSRALNDHPRISRDTKDKVWQVAKRLGYFSGMPEFAPPEKSDVITVIVPSLMSSFYREIIEGIQDYFDKKKFDVFIINARNDESMAADFFTKYKRYGISGVIHVVCDNSAEGIYSLPISEALPVVTVLEPEKNSGVSSVLPDIFHGIYDSLRYLHTIGLKKITLMLEHENCPLDNQLYNSFVSAMESIYGNADDLTVFYSERKDNKLKNFVKTLYAGNKRPDAIYIKDVSSAINVETQFNIAGVNVPQDIMLITIDTVAGVKQFSSNMSFLKLPAYDMGFKAAEMLIAQIKDPRVDHKVSIIPTNFILKGSAMRIAEPDND